ncbi:MAG: methyltransferase domain-containing protein [Candidatus Heimdallarchaeota archaeon]
MVERTIESAIPTLTGRFLPLDEVHQETLSMDGTFVRIVAEWLWAQFEHEGWGIGEAHDITDMAQAFNVKSEDLFREALDCVATTDFVEKEGENLQFVKPVPIGTTLDYLLNECPQDFGQSFPVFVKLFRAGLDKVLLGVPQGSPMNAEAWDAVLGCSFYINDRQRAFEFAKFANIGRIKDQPLRVLDFGCGTGFSGLQIQGYLNSHGIECELYGYDPTPGVVELARKRIPGLKPYILGDPRNKVVFDGVFVSHALHYIPKERQQPTIALIDKILHSPGKFFGCALFSEPDYNPHVNTCIRVLGGPGVPSSTTFESWFQGTNFKLRIDARARVFCADK